MSDTRRLMILQRYAAWLASDNGVLPGRLEELLPVTMSFMEQVHLMDDLSKAILQYIAREKVLHGETPTDALPKAVLLTLSPSELFLTHHLMCFGTVAMAAKEKHIVTSMRMVRRGLAMCGTEGVVSLFSRVNKLTMASFPEAEVIHLEKEDL